MIVLIHSTLSKSGYIAHDGKISAKGIPDKSNSDRLPVTICALFIALNAVSKASYKMYVNGNINQETLFIVKFIIRKVIMIPFRLLWNILGLF